MAKINSCSKGKRTEREFRDRLRDNGYKSARRGQQFSGSPESPDVVCEELSQFHFEVKGVERLNIWDAMYQSTKDSALAQFPVVAHKKNGESFLITMTFEDWIRLVKLAYPPVVEAKEQGGHCGRSAIHESDAEGVCPCCKKCINV